MMELPLAKEKLKEHIERLIEYNGSLEKSSILGNNFDIAELRRVAEFFTEIAQEANGALKLLDKDFGLKNIKVTLDTHPPGVR